MEIELNFGHLGKLLAERRLIARYWIQGAYLLVIAAMDDVCQAQFVKLTSLIDEC